MGEEGMEQAVFGMEIEKKIAFWYFEVSVLCYIAAVIIWMWANLFQSIAISATIVLVIFLVIYYRDRKSILTRFEIPKHSEGLDFQKNIHIPMVSAPQKRETKEGNVVGK